MTEPKRPEFKLHKTPKPPERKPEPRFLVKKDPDGVYSIEMNGYTVLGGLTKVDVMSLTNTLLTSTQVEGLGALRSAQALARPCYSPHDPWRGNFLGGLFG